LTRGRLVQVAAVSAVALVAIVFVALTLRQPHVDMFAPTTPAPRDAGTALVGPVVYTVDATSPEQWRHFAFRVGAVVEGETPWDLGFRRYQVIANGGPSYRGGAGVIDLGETPFERVQTLPTTGYQLTENRPDPHNAAIAGWYHYGFFSHVLKPKPRVWAIRTSDGRYAKMEILSYYCPAARPGCVTFRYVYQGDGSATVALR
jgi:hypothetical protein